MPIIIINTFRYRAPFMSNKTWMEKFRHVVGIIHTNYLVYTRSISGGAFKEPLLYYVNQVYQIYRGSLGLLNVLYTFFVVCVYMCCRACAEHTATR